MSNIPKIASIPQVEVSNFSDEQKDLEGINLFCHFQLNILNSFQELSLYFERVSVYEYPKRPKNVEMLLDYHLEQLDALSVEKIREKEKKLNTKLGAQKKLYTKDLEQFNKFKAKDKELEKKTIDNLEQILTLDKMKKASKNRGFRKGIDDEIIKKRKMRNTLLAERADVIESGIEIRASNKDLRGFIKEKLKIQKGLSKVLPYLDDIKSLRNDVLEQKDLFKLLAKEYGPNKLISATHVSSRKLDILIHKLFDSLEALETMKKRGFSMEGFEERFRLCFDEELGYKKGIKVDCHNGFGLYFPNFKISKDENGKAKYELEFDPK